MSRRTCNALGTVALYGPTVPQAGDEWCERCSKAIGRGECYVYAIGGGVATLCEPCGGEMLRSGEAVPA